MSCLLEPYLALLASILNERHITYELEVDVAWAGLHKYNREDGVSNGRAVLRLEYEHCASAGDVDEASVEADEAVTQLWLVAHKSVSVLGYVPLGLGPGYAEVVASYRVVEGGSVGDLDLFWVSYVLRL